MPPVVPRKRLHNAAPARKDDVATSKGKGKSVLAPPRKPTLFDDLDANATPQSSTRNSSALHQLDDSDEEASSLTSLSDADFEDVPLPKRQKRSRAAEIDESEDDEDEDIEFEDVQTSAFEPPQAPPPSGDLELTLYKDTRISLANAFGKRGPTKLDRRVRIATHCVHVQFLLWHNTVRNAWLCDPEVQGMMLSHLPPRLWDEVDRWRQLSALDVPKEEPMKKETTSGKAAAKGKGKKVAERPSRDWGAAAERLERGAVDMSHGDPLFRLMKGLSAWWKQRFRVTAPGIRKVGYMSLERLDRLTKAFRNEPHDPVRFGERIQDLDEFRRAAQNCSGSRDVGAQLFTALLRGLGLEARMVANIQPLGFGWNKLEEADPEKETHKSGVGPLPTLEQGGETVKPSSNKGKEKLASTLNTSSKSAGSIRPLRGTKQRRKILDEDGLDDFELVADESDDDSIAAIPQPTPKKASKSRTFDKDLEFPHYWTEVLSPVTNKYVAVDAVVRSVIGTNRELVESLEPRGAKADRVKQVMAYVVGYSPDGSARDVTVRYLKRQMWPGRTKGVRMPVEKVPIYNHHGKVKRYEQFDWFKSAMRGYLRGGKRCPITEVDEEEQATDLQPATPEKKEVKEGEETLQYYKQSKEFVLERHLKREEALLPTAGPVKVFRTKGKAGEANEEDVYLRSDVVQVKSAETWHKQGRAPLPGEEPLKKVPYRAATTNRRREIAEAEAVSGEKVLQGLYSFDQTDWIIPPPIQDGVIPKNEYGNIDLFAEHMCPEGAVHVPYRGAMRVCKRLQIDYAEAVVDFEFGHRMAVPVIQGVVVAEEYYDQVMVEIAKDEAERSRKEDEKKRNEVLAVWRKFLMGLRIVERIRQDYGEVDEGVEVFGHSHSRDGHRANKDNEDTAGGFLPEGYEEEDDGQAPQSAGFFPVMDEDDGGDDDEDVLMVDHGEGPAMPPGQKHHPKPQSAMSTRPKRKSASKMSSSRRRRRRQATSSEDEEEDEVDQFGDSDEDYEAQ